MIRFCTFFILLVLGIAPLYSAVKIINFEEDTETAFDNPERGDRGGNTLQRIYMDLESFNKTDAISQEWLNARKAEFQKALSEGKKLVPRFHYMYGCETQKDAPLERVLKHIEQLGPLLQENSDLIALVEAGFIGCWGEWHYYNCNDQYGLAKPENQKTILLKLLSVLPKDRMVVVRYNRYKKEIFGTEQPLGPDSAFSGSDRARVGHQNDCFLYNDSDRGTYRGNTMELQKEYLSLDTRYVPQEGETCGTTNNYARCEIALKELKRMNWDFISNGFHSLWKSGGCLNEVLMRLGYRIVLRSAALQDSVNPGGSFAVVLNLQNVGWGKIYNPRGCELIFKNTASSENFTSKLNIDPRRWCMTDSVVAVAISAHIPQTITEGTYKVYLNLPDPSARLHDLKAYSIRLANKNLWEDATGHHSLNHTVTITSLYKPPPTGISTNHLNSYNQSLINPTFSKQGKAIVISCKTAIETPFLLEVLTWNGKTVWKQIAAGEPNGIRKASLEGLSSGVYFLKVTLPSGTASRGNGQKIMYRFSIIP